MHHADADVRLADFDIPHLLIEQAFGDGFLCVGLQLAEGDVVPGTCCTWAVRGIDFACATWGAAAVVAAANPSGCVSYGESTSFLTEAARILQRPMR
jgi:hypothetical protein